MSPYDIGQLRTFATVVDAGGFSRAAARLNMTQSAVSMQIKRLEEAVGRRLLERSSRRLEVTEDGAVVLSYARRMLALQEEMAGRLRRQDVEGVVRLGVHDYLAATWLPGVLRRFHHRHPGVRLEVHTGLSLRIHDVHAAGQLDVALHSRPPGVEGGRTIVRRRRVWVAGADFEMPRQGPIPLALHPMPCLVRPAATEALDRMCLPWRVVFTAHSGASLKAAAMAGLGMTVLPVDHVPAGARVFGEAEGLPPLPELEFALFRAAEASPAAERLADELEAAAESAAPVAA